MLRIYVQRCRKRRENIISHPWIFHNSVLFLIWKNIRTERKWNKLRTQYINCFLRCPIATLSKNLVRSFRSWRKNKKSFQISTFYKLGKFHGNFFQRFMKYSCFLEYSLYLFHDRGTGFYMIETSVMKELKVFWRTYTSKI